MAYVAVLDIETGRNVRTGVSHVFVGNDGAYLSGLNTQVTDDIYSTGWHKASSDVLGRYISIRREGPPHDQSLPGNNALDYTISKLEVFQCPNLLDVDGVYASITLDTVPVSSTEPDFVAKNLLEYLSTRMNNSR